jgi:hypothetical protein
VPEWADEGGLVAYGPRVATLIRQTIVPQLVKLLGGARPADIPVELPTARNNMTASRLSRTRPQLWLGTTEGTDDQERGQGKLTAHAEAALNSGRGVKSIWTDRRGVVLRVTANKANAVVLWDGRTSTERMPIRALETEPD